MNFVDKLYKKRVTLGFIFGFIFIVFSIPDNLNFLITGIAIGILGEIIRLISSGYIIKTDKLATYGPYAFVRHPLYLGSFIMGFGLCLSIFSARYLFIGSFISLAFLLFFFAVYIPVLKKEEGVLIEKYGDEYLDYKKHVPMLIPRIFPYKSKEKGKFQKEVFLNNREYRAITGLAAIIAILVIKYLFIN
ncbi:MAG: isoprenylcysteine carboxylmethyltransferase family protein [Elusimicrobiota bacterium]